MTLRHKIWITLAVFAASAVIVALGMCRGNNGVTAGGLLLFLAGILAALFCWRCPYCGKGFDPPFKKKKCRRCGREIDYEARKRYF